MSTSPQSHTELRDLLEHPQSLRTAGLDLVEAAAVSQAISLKRIADALEAENIKRRVAELDRRLAVLRPVTLRPA